MSAKSIHLLPPKFCKTCGARLELRAASQLQRKNYCSKRCMNYLIGEDQIPKEQRGIYHTWYSMMDRCHNPNSENFPSYGECGISVCESWRNDFLQFAKDIERLLGPKPSLDHSLDRFPNNDGNYEPGNVRWGTRSQQACNRRSNHLLEFKGKRQTISEWGRELGLEKNTLQARIRKGWSVERLLSTPLRGATRAEG